MNNPKDKSFADFLANYLADVVHDIQNYTITISLGKESLWSLIRNNFPEGEDQKNVQNFLRIIDNSNNKINDIAYLINAMRIFFEGKVHLHDEKLDVRETVQEIIAKLNYKFSSTRYEIEYAPGPGESQELTMDRDAFKYLLTMLLKIQKTEKPGCPLQLTTKMQEKTFLLELGAKGEDKAFEKGAFSNSAQDFPAKGAKDEDFLKFIHFFVIHTITARYRGEFLLSRSGNCFNGFRVSLGT